MLIEGDRVLVLCLDDQREGTAATAITFHMIWTSTRPHWSELC
jgi:hypothetical protein